MHNNKEGELFSLLPIVFYCYCNLSFSLFISLIFFGVILFLWSRFVPAVPLVEFQERQRHPFVSSRDKENINTFLKSFIFRYYGHFFCSFSLLTVIVTAKKCLMSSSWSACLSNVRIFWLHILACWNVKGINFGQQYVWKWSEKFGSWELLPQAGTRHCVAADLW